MDLNNMNLLLEMELPKLWDIMKLKCEDKEILLPIKEGLKLKFDIEDYIDGYYDEYTAEYKKTKKLIREVSINGKNFNAKEFYNEIKERRLAMIKWFELNLELSTAGESREEKE